MQYDIFVLILDDGSSYIKGELSYDAAIGKHTHPESTVILVSANHVVERVIAGVDARTIEPPLQGLSSRTSTRKSDAFAKVHDWIVEVQSMREADGRPATTIGVLVDFDPYTHDALLAGLKSAKSISLIEEITPRPKPAVVPSTAEPKAAVPAPRRSKSTPKPPPVRSQPAPVPQPPGPTPAVTPSTTASSRPTQAVRSEPSKKSRSPFKVALAVTAIIAMAAIPFGQPAKDYFFGTSTDPNLLQRTPTPVMRQPGSTEVPKAPTETAEPVVVLYEETEPADDAPPIVPVSTDAPGPPVGTYYDIGGDTEPSLKRFGYVESSVEQGIGCELGGYQDQTKRTPRAQEGSEFSTISIPIARGRETTIRLCIEEGVTPVDWSVWLGNLPPAEHGCQRLHLLRPPDAVRGLNVVSWTVPAECVHRDFLLLVFVGVDNSSTAVWGLLITE